MVYPYTRVWYKSIPLSKHIYLVENLARVTNVHNTKDHKIHLIAFYTSKISSNWIKMHLFNKILVLDTNPRLKNLWQALLNKLLLSFDYEPMYALENWLNWGYSTLFQSNSIFKSCCELYVLAQRTKWSFGVAHRLRTPRESFFFQKSRTFRLGLTFWTEIFWGIRGIFGRTICTHFGTVSSLFRFSTIQPLFLQQTKSLYFGGLFV